MFQTFRVFAPKDRELIVWRESCDGISLRFAVLAHLSATRWTTSALNHWRFRQRLSGQTLTSMIPLGSTRCTTCSTVPDLQAKSNDRWAFSCCSSKAEELHFIHCNLYALLLLRYHRGLVSVRLGWSLLHAFELSFQNSTRFFKNAFSRTWQTFATSRIVLW